MYIYIYIYIHHFSLKDSHLRSKLLMDGWLGEEGSVVRRVLIHPTYPQSPHFIALEVSKKKKIKLTTKQKQRHYLCLVFFFVLIIAERIFYVRH